MTWALLRGDVGGPCAAGVLQVGNGYGVQNVQDFYRDPGGRGNIPLPMVGRHPPEGSHRESVPRRPRHWANLQRSRGHEDAVTNCTAAAGRALSPGDWRPHMLRPRDRRTGRSHGPRLARSLLSRYSPARATEIDGPT